MKPSEHHLYLGVNQHGTEFKIGIANDPVLRLIAVPEDIDFQSSYYVSGSEYTLRRLEKTLHFIFNKHNVTHKPTADGYTEWFEITSLESCIDFIIQLKQRVGFSEIKPLYPLYENYKSKKAQQTTSAKQSPITKRQHRILEIQKESDEKIFQLSKRLDLILKHLLKAKHIDDRYINLEFPDRKFIVDEIEDMFRKYGFYPILNGGFNLITGLSWSSHEPVVKTQLFTPENELLLDQSPKFRAELNRVLKSISTCINSDI